MPRHTANAVLTALAACIEATVYAVARRLGTTPSTAGRRLRQLEKSGLLTRVRVGGHLRWHARRRSNPDEHCGEWYVRRMLQLSADELDAWVTAGHLRLVPTRDGPRFSRAEVKMVRRNLMSHPTAQYRRPAMA